MNVIEAADKAQLSKMPADSHCREPYWTATDDELERFAQIIRNQALEDAAKVCAQRAGVFHFESPHNFECNSLAAAIRAMKKEQP